MATTITTTETLVGKKIRRREDPRLITGKGYYTDDMNLPGQTYMAVLRSPYGHARIRSINTDKARQLPGVVAVYTGQDLADGGAPQVPSPRHSGLGAAEDAPGHLLGEVGAHQRDHHGHRLVQADHRRGAARLDHVPDAGRDTRGQLGKLPSAQPCHSLKPQRLLPGYPACVTARDSREKPFCLPA